MSGGPHRRSVSARLIVSTLLFSSLVTLAATTLQLYLDYARDVDLIHERMRQVRDSYLESISASLWALDREQIQVQLDGIRSLPDMQKVEVLVDGQPFASAGSMDSVNSIERSFAIERVYKGERIPLGTLAASASLDGVYQRLLDKVLVILGTQAVKTFLVSAFIFLLFQYLVTRHLVRMSGFARGLGLATLDKELQLDRAPSPTQEPDELDDVVRALNEMRANLKASWAELEAEHAKRIEAERLASIGELSASIAHEIRNPLASIINGVELLGRNTVSAAGKAEVIALVNAESQRLKRILDDFLRFSRQRASAPAPGDLAAALKHVAETVRLGLTDDRGIGIVLDIDPALGRALFDREQIEQVLWNLMLNATQAMPNGGEVRVMAERNGDLCTVRVRDSGIGMDEMLRSKAGEPFVAGRANGTGLGLSTVQRILAAHGSALTIDSAPGCGTTVSFDLEAVEGECATS